MPLTIIRADITKLKVDAIVNAAAPNLLGGGGVDDKIHHAAGPELLEACKKLGGCERGDAKITNGYHLPAKYVIHTVGPIWRGGSENEAEVLRACYQNSLNLALEYKLKSIAFPIISTGRFKYPKREALEIASSTIQDFLMNHEMKIKLVVFDNETLGISQTLFSEVKAYINENYVAEDESRQSTRLKTLDKTSKSISQVKSKSKVESFREINTIVSEALEEHAISLEDILIKRNATFTERLLKLIDNKGMKDSEVYKKANIDRKLFSKIRSNKNYQPSKKTVIAFALALELSLEETEELLQTAGYTLSLSLNFDLVIRFFLEKRNYNIFEVNEVLFANNEPTLGA